MNRRLRCAEFLEFDTDDIYSSGFAFAIQVLKQQAAKQSKEYMVAFLFMVAVNVN